MFDATQFGRKPLALGVSWRFGSRLYRALGHVHARFGARSWSEALAWLARYEPARPISEVQYWGHGNWGRANIGREPLDRDALAPNHPLRRDLDALRERLAPDALLWFRTCETIGARAGQDFAAALADFTGAVVAGHTFEIGVYQSGLHALRPGMRPHWPASEGLARGTAQLPERSLPSHPSAPNTITCFTSAIPAEFAAF